jgi:hypothetical protein
LERYALGELSEAERRAVERRLACSAEDRACLARIEADDAPLPPLPEVLPRAVLPARSRGGRVAAGAAALLAAALGLLALLDRRSLDLAAPSSAPRTKGGDVVLELRSEHGQPATHFAQGERMKVLVTCPPDLDAPMRLLVFQAGRRYEPLPPFRPSCGNRVPWPGAFALDGDAPVYVCVAWGNAAGSARDPGELGAQATCAELTPK